MRRTTGPRYAVWAFDPSEGWERIATATNLRTARSTAELSAAWGADALIRRRGRTILYAEAKS